MSVVRYIMYRFRKNFAKVFVAILVLVMPYLMCVNVVHMHEVGLAYDTLSGKVWVQQPGVYFTHPMVMVPVVDTRPHRVCIEYTVKATNCKLVQFNPRHTTEFIQVEGHRYYWWYNRISINFGYTDEYRGWLDVLRGYAFGLETYPFIEEL